MLCLGGRRRKFILSLNLNIFQPFFFTTNDKMHIRTSSSKKQITLYQYEPLQPIASTSSSAKTAEEDDDKDDDEMIHYTSFARKAIKNAEKPAWNPKRLPVVTFDTEEEDGNESDSSLSSLSNFGEDSEIEKGDNLDSTPKANKIRPEHQPVTPSLQKPSSNTNPFSQETFSLGDVVYIESNLTRPHLGILTDILSHSKPDETESDMEEEIILCKLRHLYWPQDVSQVTSAKLTNLVDNDEVYYTHQAPKLLGRRRTKNSLRGGEGAEALTDNFEYGPSLLNMVVKADAILGKVTMHASALDCRRAVAASNSSSRQNGVLFKRKRMPSHLFVKRAIDPQKEVFWNVDWDAVLQRGKKNGKWDLAEGDDDVRKRIEENEAKPTITPLTTPGKNANEWAKMLAKEKGIPLTSTTKDRQEVRKQLEAKRIAALLDTPSKRRQERMREKEERKMARATGNHRPHKRAKLDRNPDGEMSSAESASDLYDSEEDESVTSVTSDDEFALDEESEAESMLDLDDSLFMDDEDDHDWDTATIRRTPSKKRAQRSKYIPSTPRKKRLLNGLTSSPAKAMVTPKSKMRILGTVSLAPTSLPARPKALDALPIKEVETMTARQRAKRLLHVGATPESLPCRQEQFEEVMACLEDAVEDGLGGCVYISGVPGTGKTATVREVIRDLQKRAEKNELSPFNFVEMNGMKLQDAHDAYGVLWHSLTGMRCSNANALHHLSQHFGTRQRISSNKISITPSSMMGPGRATTVVLMDELDQMITTRQDVMYNMFNWPNSQDSRLVVIAIANTMDLPERVLHAKVASRLGMTRITFKPYNDRELVQIVHARLGIQSEDGQERSTTTTTPSSTFIKGCQTVFAPEALVYLAKRVSNVSGDARRMLDVCRRAIDAIDENANKQSSLIEKSVTIGDMKKVLDAMVKSGKGAHINHLSLQKKMVLIAILAAVRRAGKAEVDLGTITITHANLCRMHAIPLPNESNRNNALSSAGIHRIIYDEDDMGRLTTISYLLNHLCALGLIIAVGTGVAAARSGRYARYVLACAEDEVRLALEQDEDVRLRNLL